MSLLSLSSLPAAAQEASGAVFIREVLHMHPVLRQGRKLVQAAELEVEASRLQPNPNLQLSATVGDAVERANQITQNLEVFGRTHWRWKVADAGFAATKRRLEASEREVVAGAYAAWLGFWKANRLVRLARLRQDLMEETVRVARRRFEVGEIAENESLRVQLAAAQAATGAVRREAALRSAQRTVYLLIGEHSEHDWAEALTQAPPPLLGEVTLPDILLSAEEHPSLLALKADADARDFGARLLGKERSPILGISAYRSELFGTGQIGQGVQLSVSWPIVDWGRISTRAEKKRVEAEAIQAAIDVALLEVRTELSQRWTELEAARENRDILIRQSERYEELAREARVAYDLGMLNLTDLLQTEASFREARVDLVEAESEVLEIEVGLWEKTTLPLPLPLAKELSK